MAPSQLPTVGTLARPSTGLDAIVTYDSSMIKKICCLLALMLITGCTSATAPLEGRATVQITAAPLATAPPPNLTPTPLSLPTMTPAASPAERVGQSSGDANPFAKPAGLALAAQGNR